MPSRGRERLFLSFLWLPGVGNIRFQKKIVVPEGGNACFREKSSFPGAGAVIFIQFSCSRGRERLFFGFAVASWLGVRKPCKDKAFSQI